MKKRKILFLVSIVFLVPLFPFAKSPTTPPTAAYSLMAGTAKVNITPRTPIPMSGYGGRTDPFKGVHDELFARVIVLSDGKNKVALISTDLIGISNAFWSDVTDALEKKTGIRREFVLLSAVHNHNGPGINVYEENTDPEVLAYIAELKEKIIA